MDVIARRGQAAHSWDTVQAAWSFVYLDRDGNLPDLPGDRQEQMALLARIVDVVPTGGRSSSPDELCRCAMLLLGRLRSGKAIDLLVANIAFPADEQTVVAQRSGFGITLPPDPIAVRSPAVAALAEIGEPCIDRVVEKLTTTESGSEFACCIAVLQQLKVDAARPKLDAALKHAKPEFRARVDAAMKKVAKPTDLREHARRVEEAWERLANP
jgi:hypothetical protein